MQERDAVLDQVSHLARTLAEVGCLGSWQIDYRSDVIRVGSDISSLFGLDAEIGTLGMPLRDTDRLHHPDDLPWLKEERKRSAGPSCMKVTEYRVIDGRDQIRWLRLRSRVEMDRYGIPIFENGITFDVTAQRSEGGVDQITPNSPLPAPLDHLAGSLIQALRAAEQLGLSRETNHIRALLIRTGRSLARQVGLGANSIN